MVFRYLRRALGVGWLFLLFPSLSAQDQNDVCLYNTGKMYVGGEPANTALRIEGSLRMKDSASTELMVTQAGTTRLSGNFWHDALNHVFTNYADAPTVGKIVFQGENREQTITSSLLSYNLAVGGDQTGATNRKTMFLNMPDVEVTNHVRLTVTPQMGVSVHDLLLTNGNIRLKSDANVYMHMGTSDKADASSLEMDASLLVSGTVSYASTSVNNAGGHAEIERNLAYNLGRIAGEEVTYKYVGFSAPLSNMYMDYFTNHWVYDLTNNEYEIRRYARFIPGRGYYLVVRGTPNPEDPENYVKDDQIINTNSFVFNRSYYSDFLYFHENEVSADDKQFPQEKLTTENCVIQGGLIEGYNYLGNPYTCALSIPEMFESWGMEWTTESEDNITPKIWLWAGQSDNSLVVTPDMSTTDGMETIIPSQQMFAIEAKQAQAEFAIPASARVHNPMRFLRANKVIQNELLLEIKDAELGNYSRVAIGLRSWGKPEGDDRSDAEMSVSRDKLVPQCYALSSDNIELSINSLPEDTRKTDLHFIPAQYDGEREYLLQASRQYSMETEAVLLKDNLTGEIIDLRKTDSYVFSAHKDDPSNRFTILFAPENVSGLDETNTTLLTCRYAKGELIVKGLQESDLNATLSIYDMQGRLLQQSAISDYPEQRMEIHGNNGLYIAKLAGNRNISFKFRKGDTK